MKAVLARWSDVVILGLFSSGLTAYLGSHFLCGQAAPRTLPTWPVWAPILAGCLLLFRGRIWPWLGLPRSLFYPPTWFAAVIGAILLLEALLRDYPVLPEACFPVLIGDPELSTYWAVVHFALIALVTVPVAFALGGWVLTFIQRGSSSTVVPTALTLLEWVMSDAPIAEVEHDRFALAPVAVQMTALVSGIETSCVALIGALGTGKTSIRELVTSGLRSPSIRLIRVSLWPYESVDAAIAGLLRELTTALSSFTSTETLTWLPEDYVDLIDDIAGPLKKLVRLGKTGGPGAQLRKIDGIGVALGIKLILWVEDLERFAGFASSSGQPEYLRLGSLRALLNELSELQSVQVVLASAAVDARFDLEKLARHVVTIPTPDRAVVAKIVREFRDCLLASSPDHVDPVRDEERKRLWPDEASIAEMSRQQFSGDSAALRVAEMCGTPRRLKHVLRQCHSQWSILRGEIDFDDLLLITALRYAMPAVFELINHSINDLRSGFSDRSRGGEVPSRFATKVESLLAGQSDSMTASIRWTLGELFPGWIAGGRGADRTKKHPQCLSSLRTDYWSRLVALKPVDPPRSDQRMLRQIKHWRIDGSQALVETLVEGGFPDSLESFISHFSTAELLRLLDAVIAGEIKRDRRPRNPYGLASLIVIWRPLLSRTIVPTELLVVLAPHVTVSAKTNLALAFSLTYLFGNSEANVRMLLEDQHRKVLQAALHSVLVEFEGKPKALIAALTDSPHETLKFCCWGAARARTGDRGGVPFAAWPRFAAVLVDSLKIDPATMLPQLVNLLVISQDDFHLGDPSESPHFGRKYSCDVELIHRLFGAPLITAILGQLKLEDGVDEMRATALAAFRSAADQPRLIPEASDSAAPPKPAGEE